MLFSLESFTQANHGCHICCGDYRPIFSEDHPIKHIESYSKHDSGMKQTQKKLNPEAQQAAKLYPLRVPSAMASKIAWDNPQDPLLRQIMPTAEELRLVEGFGTDPLAETASRHHACDSNLVDRTNDQADQDHNRIDQDNNRTGQDNNRTGQDNNRTGQDNNRTGQETYIPGLLQKYHGRVLLQLSGECAIHCRFCFRRHDHYRNIPKTIAAWSPALAVIANDPSIHEVLLSGGDPLMVTDKLLTELTQHLDAIPHLSRLRIHSRMPVVTPKRITPALIRLLTTSRLTTIMVIHCNHPKELDQHTTTAIARLINAGIPVLNQTVLLKGVNDDADTLTNLCETLINHRVLPYYLHLLDRVAGAAHFQVEEEQAHPLIAQLQSRLPGYAIPKLVREEPGKPSKTLL